MNITHYCSKCDKFHADISCAEFQRRYPAIDSIDVQLPGIACGTCGADGVDYLCACSSGVSHAVLASDNGSDSVLDVAAHNREMNRITAALDAYQEQQEAKYSFSELDAIRAHALGVRLDSDWRGENL